VQVILKWFRETYRKTISSIAFIPAVIAFLFLLMSVVMVQFDFSSAGKEIKASLHWLSLKDASTARSICTAIAGGIISLAVFSFSMVMILLNQAASQMSNRILSNLIGNRFQQYVLGFYIGTIVYALFLLSTIRDVDSGINVPAISTYLLIAFTVLDIFLFIYFLHYITESVKFETIISRVYTTTDAAMKKACSLSTMPEDYSFTGEGIPLGACRSGVYQGFDKNELIEIAKKENIFIQFLYPAGSFVIEGNPLCIIYNGTLAENVKDQINVIVNIEKGQEINISYHYGFQQLAEIAIKALSPGINDPGTAVLALQALASLMVYRFDHFAQAAFKDNEGKVRVIAKEKTITDAFK
ncbi:MAG: DUF2254 domain-containing protein, partial [Chitinophagaceae bacterium]|nr:DUF2254 domain-containing protein [Chitinophagaceae bacterium]